jgi:endonuclease/exonuclease/phosphatase family metal-dependent hydrolase
MTYNVHSCVGLDGRLSPERIARVIARHDPDVVALQELDVGRARTGGVDQAQVIAEHLEMLLQFHATVAVEEERFGDAVLSRLPMDLVRLGALPQLRRRPGRPPLERRGAIWVEITTPAGPFHIVNTHLSLHPVERRLQAEALVGPDWIGSVPSGAPAVLCGDFNALAWFPTCRRIGRRMRDVQAGRAGQPPRGTWGGRLPLGRIDHVFVDPTIEVPRVDVPRDARAKVASDHLPLIVDLRLLG